jgi:hypothetical protein
MEKGAILVCSSHIKGRIPQGRPAGIQAWRGMTLTGVVRDQQSGVKFANGAIRALYAL